MSYPVYKLLRAVNRQYPNNGFINYVDVTESIYDTNNPETNRVIDEDLRDLLNETLQEIYIDIAKDEVYSFPTVAGQNQYELPDDCDLRDIQEVTRTYAFRPLRPPHGGPIPPLPTVYTLFFDANGGTGEMDPLECNIGESITLPECEFTSPGTGHFTGWQIGEDIYQPGDTYEMQDDTVASAKWVNVDPSPVWNYTVTFKVDQTRGTISAPQAIMSSGSIAIYDNSGSDYLPEVPTVMPTEGTTFYGWSLTGNFDDIIYDETIIATPITTDLTYYGVLNDNVDPSPEWEDAEPQDPGVDPEPLFE